MVTTLTRHVEERMRKRGITREDLEHARSHPVGNPQPGEIGSMWVLGRTPGGRILKVCVATDDRNRIITAVWADTCR
jgi:hypothetical protein